MTTNPIPAKCNPSSHLRFIDLCAGLGGFHHGLDLAKRNANASPIHFECVAAADLDDELREVYVRNYGQQIAATYRRHFPPEIAPDLYTSAGELARVHGDMSCFLDADTKDGLKRRPDSDEHLLPDHDLLCAGFPCQPFSKSGYQLGFADLRGTVFGMIATILRAKRPAYVLLENVGNFERHNGGDTWVRVKETLEHLGYDVRATTHIGSTNHAGAKGWGLLSPHHIGLPHHRERFFILAQQKRFGEAEYPFPISYRVQPDWTGTLFERPKDSNPPYKSAKVSRLQRLQNPQTALDRSDAHAAQRLNEILNSSLVEVGLKQLEESQLSAQQIDYIQHWNGLLKAIDDYESKRSAKQPSLRPLPSFPMWGWEFDPWNRYPNPSDSTETVPAEVTDEKLAQYREVEFSRFENQVLQASEMPIPKPTGDTKEFADSTSDLSQWKETWPQYAKRSQWPRWKHKFIKQNREWSDTLWKRLGSQFMRGWLDKLYTFPASYQKLEWNCQGEVLDLWQHILQLRPSGIRAKRLIHVPALVAMTTTQIPIVPVTEERDRQLIGGHAGRFLLRSEALQLLGLPKDFTTPESHAAAYKAFGNGVHAGLVSAIVERWLLSADQSYTSPL